MVFPVELHADPGERVGHVQAGDVVAEFVTHRVLQLGAGQPAQWERHTRHRVSIADSARTAMALPHDRRPTWGAAYPRAEGLNELVGTVGKLAAHPAAGQQFHDRDGDPAGGLQRLPGLAEGERAG